jgi:uncharacterized protein (DUF2141 family)
MFAKGKKIFMFVFHQSRGILMRQTIFRLIITVVIVCTLINSCAKVSTPAGGPRDKTPPVIIKTNPENGSRFFKGDKFEITFNEYVALDKINDKFLVSPPMKKKPEVSIKGKSVVVKYEDELRDSTTYNFIFQDAVRDVNEGNVYDNLQFVFSTGPVVDSLSVTGNVLNAFVLDIPENPLILLYRDLSPAAFRESLPEYISKADKNGYFRIDNIRPGTYRLYALKEKDNSGNFNLPDEEIAFLNEPVEISPEKNYLPVKRDTVAVKKTQTKNADTAVVRGEYKLILFQHEKTMRYLTSSSRNLQYLLTYTLTLPPENRIFDFSIPGISEDLYFIERSRNNDTMNVWLTDSTLYSTQTINTVVTYPLTDTTGTIISQQDTIAMRFFPPRASRVKVKPALYNVKSNISRGQIKPGEKIIFESTTPFKAPDTSKIRIYEIKETLKIPVPYTLIKDSTNSCRIIMNVDLARGKNYLYIADSASFCNIYGECSDSTGFKVSLREEKSFGKLILNIKGYEGSRIIQLLDKNEKPVTELQMSKDGKAEFPMLDKGTYRIRVIYDLNNDGRWTTGNYNFGIQPEPVSFYPGEIEIKEDWVFDQDWDISSKNIKKLKNIPRASEGR